jgi:NAD(P)-dependent dehydrogenase (short-subunit alcohol dehydrogenase family)
VSYSIYTRRHLGIPGKTGLITGANKGIGYETARQLGGLGYRIWLGCRDDLRGRSAAEKLSNEGHEVRLLQIDVADESARKAAEIVRTADGKLDILINNAGIVGGPLTVPSAEEIGNIRTVYETNVFGPIRVTQAFLPLLKSAEDTQIVMVSSGLGSLTLLSDPKSRVYSANILGYNSSKTALNGVTVAFAKELSSAGIRVNAVDPGYTATDLNGHSGPRSVKEAAAGIVWLVRHPAPGPTGKLYYNDEPVPW